MMNHFLLFLCILGFFTSCSPKGEEEIVLIQVKEHDGSLQTFNEKERLEKFASIDYLSPQPYSQVLRVFRKNLEDKGRSILTSYHPNGQIKQCMEGIDSVAKGPYYEWHANGNKKIEARVIGGAFDLHYASQQHWLFDGISKVWDEEGRLLAEIAYDMGMLHGESKYYYQNGQLKTRIPYKKRRVHGAICLYYPNGHLQKKTYYQHGKKHGSSLGYWENEEPSLFEEYAEDRLLNAIYYDQKGTVVSQVEDGYGFRAEFSGDFLSQKVEYQEGIPEGCVILYASCGKVTGKYHQKEGKKHGTETLFYPMKGANSLEPQIKLSVDWDDDTIHGFVKTWYPNGKMESQKEYYRNQKNGTCFAWYQDGSLMLIEEYEKDLLQEGAYYKAQHQAPLSKVTEGEGIATLFDGESFAFLRKIVYARGKPVENP